MNILSLFDGMSCGQIALNRAGIKYDNYYASEIDKYAIKVTQANYPNTIQLGSVIGLQPPVDIDLLIGGSPCQGFSFAGKQLAFDDLRSKLFFEWVRVWQESKPKWWLLENVKMKKEHENVISSILKTRPYRFNSAWVSAQNRERLYWTNIPVFSKPENKGVVLKDILETNEVDESHYASDAVIERMNKKVYSSPKIMPDKTGTLNAKNNSGQWSLDSGTTFVFNDISHNTKSTIFAGGIEQGRRLNDGKTLAENFSIGYRVWDDNGKFPAIRTADMGKILSSGKCNTLTPDAYIASGARNRDENGNAVLTSMHDRRIRKLTPIECERLQTVPDNYTNHVSSTQRYKMLGNGWTVDIIVHFFKHIPLV